MPSLLKTAPPAPEKVLRYAQFCSWLRLDVRFLTARGPQQLDECSLLESVRLILGWSQRQAVGQNASAFNDLGERDVNAPQALEQIAMWARRMAVQRDGVEAPEGLLAKDAGRLIGEWKDYIVRAHASPRLGVLLQELTQLRSPLREKTFASDPAEPAARPVHAPEPRRPDAPESSPRAAAPLAGPASAQPVPVTEAEPDPAPASPPAASTSTGLLRLEAGLRAVTPSEMSSMPIASGRGQGRRAWLAVAVLLSVALAGAWWWPRSAPAADADLRLRNKAVGPSQPAAPVPPPVPPPSPSSSAAADDMLRVTLVAQAEGRTFDVGPDAPLPSHTRFYFKLQPDRLLYVQLYRLDDDGHLRPLFPSARERVSSWPVQPPLVQEFPPKDPTLWLNGSPGIEHLVFLAASEPIGGAGLPLARVIAQVGWPARWPPLKLAGALVPKATRSPKPVTRGVDVVYGNVAPPSDEALVLARFVTIDHTAP